jgi:SAM-dependent methyltransferase
MPAGLKLHLGCGHHVVEGWVNIDGAWGAWFGNHPVLATVARALRVPVPAWPRGVRRNDLRRRLPFESHSAEAIYASHILEHLHLEDADRLLADCGRVLRPGGILRVVVPDLAAIVEEYLGRSPFATPIGGDTPGDRMNARLRGHEPRRPGLPRRLYDVVADFHTHKWMYDADSVVARLGRAGFPNAVARPYLDSGIPDIAAVEVPWRVCGGEGVCVEGHRS